MKRIYIVCIVLFCVFRNTNLFAQVASVEWQLTSNQNPNTPIGNIQALPQSIGTPTSSYVLAIYPNQPYTSRGQQLWTGNQGTGWIAGPPDYTRYMQFDASPDSGNDLSVQYISFNYSDTENPTNTDFHILKGEVWCAIDNNWNNSVQINSSPLDYLSSAIQTFSVNVNLLVQNGQTFSLRIYPYAPNGGRAMTPSFAVHKNVIIEGRTTPVVLNTGSICGMKFNDLNGNGRKDSGELGLAGWTINLSMGAVNKTATTGADGSYCFNDLPAGTYTLYETPQGGWQQTYPTNPSTHTVVLPAGQTILNVDFGNMQYGSVGGMKFNDLDGDGEKDEGEPGISGWIIALTMGASPGGDGVSITTDENGEFHFVNVPPGVYTLQELQQGGWDQTYPDSPGTYILTITSGLNLSGKDFGNKQLLGSICGFKILDKDGDGVRDSNEDIIPNWGITLTDGTTTYTATTGADGQYCFNNLPAGTYTVAEEHRTGFRQIFPPAPGVHTITLLPGENKTNINFSNVEDISTKLGSICGKKFNDINGDGDQDLPNEVGLPGWTFQLTGGSIQTVVTDLNGDFCFTNLRAGTYTIKEVIQDGWEPTAPNTTGILNITLLEGENREGIFFGNKEKLGSICGVKYNDVNNNGKRDPGEPGIPNFEITLDIWGTTSSGHAGGPTLTHIASVITDQNGIYCFNNVRQGNYLVGEIQKDGFTKTEPSGFAHQITLTAGQKIEGLNFGNRVDVTVRLGSICGIKFNDKDGDGVQDPGELGIPEWQINIGGAVDKTVVTDKEGKFCFDNLPPGEYKVGEGYRSGWRQTKPSTNFYIVQLASGQKIDLEFGNTKDDTVQLGSICGTKFNDKNRDGRKVDGEPRIAGWIIYLEGPMNLTAVTDKNGDFCFYGLIPGTYTVREKNEKGWRQTKPSSITYTLEVGNGDNFTQIDFGNFEDPTVTLGSICGMKFNDLNGDGRKQDNEPVIENWTINLSGTMNLTTRTDARGKFCFDNLKFGHYTLAEAQKDRWRQTAPSTGSYTFELSEDNSKPDTFYFGNKEDISAKVGSICGMKYLDKNGNGKKDLTEPGIADWQINISGPVDRSIKTDKEGKYCFDDLPPGTYIIKEGLKTDWVQTDPASPNYYTVVLPSGENLTGYYFGNKYEPKPGCVDPPGGMVAWWHLDFSARDGRQDIAGFNNVGTMINGPLQVAGKVLGALQFDGVDDYVEVADHSELNFGTGDFSFDAWIKTAENSGLQTLVSKRASTGYAFFLNSGNLGLTLSVPSIAAISFVPSVFVADGNWHHIAVTVSRTNKQGIIFYVDGVATPYGDPTPYQGSLTNSALLMIGKQQPPNPSFNFKGILDEIELFKRVLTPQEVQAIYNAGSAGKCKPDNSGGSVSGTVWDDRNHNGIMDPNEVGLAQWPVLLNGQTIAQIETNNDGNFVFTDCKPGDYTLWVGYQNNWSGTYPRGGRYSIKLEEGQRIDGLNFGFADDPCSSGQKTWSPLGSGIDWVVKTLAANENVLYAGGWFSVAGGISVNKIAKWNGSSWEPLVDINNPLVFNAVNELAIMNGELYASVEIQLTTNSVGMRIVKWDGQNWSVIGNGSVYSLTSDGASLFAGGAIPITGFNAVYNVVKWDGLSLLPLVSSNSSTGFNSAVYALAVMEGELYAAGNFTTVDGISANHIAKWNGNNWLALGSGINGNVKALAVNETELYAAGSFTTAGGIPSNNIAKWDGSSWSPLVNSNGSNGVSGGIVASDITALSMIGDDLYAAGYFSTAGGVSANHIAKWDGTNWSALGNGIYGANIYTDAIVSSLATNGTDLIAAGAFSMAGNINASNIAKYSCSGTLTSVDDDNTINTIPQQFLLSQNYPNPFNPTTTIRYDIPKAVFVKITIYDILGREIKVLVNEEKNPGVYEVKFDAKNLASGVYFYTIRTGDFIQSKKMILMK